MKQKHHNNYLRCDQCRKTYVHAKSYKKHVEMCTTPDCDNVDDMQYNSTNNVMNATDLFEYGNVEVMLYFLLEFNFNILLSFRVPLQVGILTLVYL